MNEENQISQEPVETQSQPSMQVPPQLPKTPADKSNFYWAIALLAMALFFGFGVLLTYLGLTKKFVFNEPLNKTQTEETMMYKNNQNGTGSAETDDANKDPAVVTDELLIEIDDLEKTDVEGAYDDRSLDTVNQ